MGMDVYGLAPLNESGRYFRNNVWYWRPLAIYCEKIAPGLTDYEKWHFNDGAGLDGPASLHLADLLEAELVTGRTQAFAEMYKQEQEATPDDPCNPCNGTGMRDDQYVKGECNACGGKGHRKHFMTLYPFEVDNVKEWITFLRNCGGFEIR